MGRLFWTSTNNDAIMMSNLDGSLPRPILNEGLRQPCNYTLHVFYYQLMTNVYINSMQLDFQLTGLIIRYTLWKATTDITCGMTILEYWILLTITI